jgi:hypothetical protein
VLWRAQDEMGGKEITSFPDEMILRFTRCAPGNEKFKEDGIQGDVEILLNHTALLSQ